MLYRTTMKVEILSDRPWTEEECQDLSVVHYAITEGSSSGVVKDITMEIITGKEMAAALIAQGSAPEFLDLDDDGNSLGDNWPMGGN